MMFSFINFICKRLLQWQVTDIKHIRGRLKLCFVVGPNTSWVPWWFFLIHWSQNCQKVKKLSHYATESSYWTQVAETEMMWKDIITWPDRAQQPAAQHQQQHRCQLRTFCKILLCQSESQEIPGRSRENSLLIMTESNRKAAVKISWTMTMKSKDQGPQVHTWQQETFQNISLRRILKDYYRVIFSLVPPLQVSADK